MFGSSYGASIATLSRAALGSACLLAGCASHEASVEPERLGRSSSSIVGSTPSATAQDAVVMLVFSDPAENKRGICTAALLAPRLVLTARHCVAETDADVACSVEGQAINGGAVRANHDPRKLHVFTGKERPDLDVATWKPAGRGVEIFDDGSDNLCDHDLALVVLEEPITGVPFASIRLDGKVGKGERLTTVGWGVTSSVDEPAARQQRSGVVVTRVGPDEADPVLTPNEIGFDESICLGDSGGPILSESTNAVVGVVSRGGNGTSSRSDLASTCTGATNLGTKITPFRDLVMRAFARAGAEPLLEERATDDDEGGGCSMATRPARVHAGVRGGGSSACAAFLALALLGAWRFASFSRKRSR